MAFDHSSPSFKLIGLLLLLVAFCSATNAAQNQRFRRLLRMGSSLPSRNCSIGLPQVEARKKNSMVMTHKYGPCSPLGGAAIAAPSLGDVLARDQARLAYFRRRMLKNQTSSSESKATHTTIGGRSGDAFSLIGFVATFGIGSGAVQQTVQVDTGSDLCWLHCTPCARKCHQQKEALFNPHTSASYRNLTCEATYCREVQKNGCAELTDDCQYSQQYADDDTTSGNLADDTLTLNPTNVFTNFIFGCDNGGGSRSFRETTAGVFGFGRGTLSIVSQLSSTYGNTFSYCVPRSPSSAGFITFGGTASSSTTAYTPMLTGTAYPSFYVVELMGVRVSGQDYLNVMPSSQGTIVDSGTSFTYLPPATYDALRSAVAAGMSGYRPTVVGGLEDCYDFTEKGKAYVPSVELLLRGVTLDLSPENVFNMVDKAKGCLAFRPSPGGTINIIGYMQLKTYELVHDLDDKTIHFVEDDGPLVGLATQHRSPVEIACSGGMDVDINPSSGTI